MTARRQVWVMGTMRTLYIHCGLAKTGTTSLQDYLFRRKVELLELGYDYSSIGVSLGRNAQHNLAFELLEDARFDPSVGTTADLLSDCSSADRAPNILISSESLAVALTKDGARERFLSFLRTAQEFNDTVYAVFTFRSFWRRMESAYFEDLKIGRQIRPLRWHVENNKGWLANFFRQMDQLRNIIGTDHIIALDIETENKDSISAVLASIGLDEDRLPRRRKQNLNVRLSLKKAAYLYLLQYDANGAFKNQTEVDPFSIVRAIRDIPVLPNDTLDYRMFPPEMADEIQEFSRAALPSFLRKKLWRLAEPESTPFDAINLADVQLTEEDDAIIKAAILAHREKNAPASAHGTTAGTKINE